jgi:nucleoside 2-deoxyribosyltransferase
MEKLMNYLSGKKVYLSGPIMNSSDDGVEWRKDITPVLENRFQLEILDPCQKHIALGDNRLNEIGESKKKFRELILNENWDQVKKDFWPIVRTDLRLVDHCDFIILDHDPTIPTVGTIHELVVATFEKKVVLLKYSKDQLESFNPWMATFIKPHHFFPTWDLMWNYLEEVDNGLKDTSYWVL